MDQRVCLHDVLMIGHVLSIDNPFAREEAIRSQN